MKVYNQYKVKGAISQVQKLPLIKKTKEWREDNVDYVIGAASKMNSSSEKKRMEENLGLYLGNFDIEKLKYVTDPFEQKSGFPATAHNINIIKSKVDLLIGEEINTAIKPTAYCTSNSSSKEINGKKTQDIISFMLQSLISGMDEKSAMDLQNKLQSGEIKDPREILGLSGSLTYKSALEESARTLVEYLYEFLSIKDIFSSAFFDLLVNGKEICYAGIASGEPTLERVDPSTIDYILSTSESSGLFNKIEDAEMICRVIYMTPSEIYDRLYHIADESDLDKILEEAQTGSSGAKKAYGDPTRELDYNHIDFTNVAKMAKSSEGRLPVYHVLWRSFKKVGFLVYLDEYQIEQSTVVSEDYVKIGNEVSLTWDWIPEIWEGYRIAQDIYIGVQPLAYQNINEQNLLTQKMPYFGIELPAGASIVDSLKPLQYLYIIIWYRLELAIAKDKGRVMNMDIRKIPKSLGVDPEKWLHLLSSVGVNFYNPSDTGFDNNEDSMRDTSNGMNSSDLSMSNVISEYVNILDRIEAVAEQISGISRQRSGFTKSSEYVGAIEQSIGQSSLITEPIFWAHEVFKKNALKYLVNMSKDVYYTLGKNFLSFTTSDGARAARTLDEGFFFEDYDIFINSSRKESKDLAVIKSLYQPAMQNGTRLSDIATIVSLNSVISIKTELMRLEEQQAIAEQSKLDQEQQAQERVLQSREASDKMLNELELMKMDLERYKIDANNQAKIAVAELMALGYSSKGADGSVAGVIGNTADESTDEADKNSNDEIKAIRERNKTIMDLEDLRLKNKKLDNDIKVSGEKLKLEKQKLEIEKSRANSQSRSNN